MKTYLTLFFSSNGAPPSEVIERLTRMGFRPIAGHYDFEYEWNGTNFIDGIAEIGNQVHATLEGCNVFFKLETVPTE